MTSSNKEKESKVKIFAAYAKKYPVYKSDVIQPIITSNTDWNEPDFLHDNTGDNISDRNKHYAELSGHYWVWKNFLPKTDAEYIGFCHYRRFFDFDFNIKEKIAYVPVNENDFNNFFTTYTEEAIYNKIKDYDIIMPYYYVVVRCEPIYNQYISYHPKKDIDLALQILKEFYPDYAQTASDFMQDFIMRTCINFIMKKELVNEYMEWIFSILFEVEKRSDWSNYTGYNDIRTPAYLAERFLNIWVLHNIKTRKLKYLNTSTVLVTGSGYDNIDQNSYIYEMYPYQKLIVKTLEDVIKKDINS